MFIPVKIGLGAGGEQAVLYDRSIEITSRQLAAFRHEAGNMTEPFSIIGKELRTSVAAQFATQGAMGATGKWTVLSEAYGTWKEKHAPGTPILVGLRRSGPKGQRPQTYKPSGAMRLSLLDPLATHVTPSRLLYAPTSQIAGYHETGTADMPARPPLDLTLQNLRAIDRTFVTWLASIMKRTGL